MRTRDHHRRQDASARIWITALALLTIAACAQLPASKDEKSISQTKPTTTETGLRLIVEPFPDFYFQARAQRAGIGEPLSLIDGVADAYLPVHDTKGSWGGFWRFDLPGLLSSSPEEFGQWFVDAPESVTHRGTVVPVRAPGLAMFKAMQAAWPEFLTTHWPGRSGELGAALKELETDFLPRHQAALGYMLDSLGIDDPMIEVPMVLVLESHPPGASTYRSKDGPIAVLSINDLLAEGRASDLHETLLHETCHVLDGASRGDNAFSRLRENLEQRGIARSDQRYHDVPHLVMFVQSAETMRRHYDAEHIAYGDTQRGDTAPLYERSGIAADIVRRHWTAYLDGRNRSGHCAGENRGRSSRCPVTEPASASGCVVRRCRGTNGQTEHERPDKEEYRPEHQERDRIRKHHRYHGSDPGLRFVARNKCHD